MTPAEQPSRWAATRPSLRDAVARRALWLAFRLLRTWWYFRRPPHRGAVVAVWLDGRILLLRHSYRGVLGWPGGSLQKGETPEHAARRELYEELGLALVPEALSFATEMRMLLDFRRDRVSIFELRLAGAPALRLDNREVVAAGFFEPEAALALPIAPFIRLYLEQLRDDLRAGRN